MSGFNYRGREPRPHRVEIRLSDSEVERLNQVCAELELNASVILRRALKLYVDGATDDGTPDPKGYFYTEGNQESRNPFE